MEKGGREGENEGWLAITVALQRSGQVLLYGTVLTAA
jgi:hypothetical protein